MPRIARLAFLPSLISIALLAAYGVEQALASFTDPTPEPQVEQPVVAWTFPEGSRIAGVEVGGATIADATKLVSSQLAKLQVPLPLTLDPQAAGPNTPLLIPAEVGLTLNIAQLIGLAQFQARQGQVVDLDWTPRIALDKLYTKLQALAPAFEQASTTELITDTSAITTTFTFRGQPGSTLDVSATAGLLARLLRERTEPLPATIVLAATAPQHPALSELEYVLEQQLVDWSGVAAVYVYDLETDQSIGVNADTVFSGASVMKVPIMIYAYAKLGVLDDGQRKLMENMIVSSDNQATNALLAAAAGGQGTEAALTGVTEMSEMLAELGFLHTYQLLPYESEKWLVQQIDPLLDHPYYEGEPPYTKADPYVRTTPREMGQLFVMLAECAEGRGLLIQKYGDTLDRTLCNEMIAWLVQPRELQWMVAGIEPGVKVAHKSGWLDDMQSDTGIVYSPNGRYVAAIYLWREHHIDNGPSPYLANVSHTIYSFFNPEPIRTNDEG
jgi:beta-lactamase class A